MAQVTRSRRELLRYFSRSTSAAFTFLEVDFSCLRSEGFSTFDGNGAPSSLRPSDFSEVPGLFMYVVRYRDQAAVLDLDYGDREMLIEEMIYYPDHQLRFYPTILLAAARIPRGQGGAGGMYVETVEYMERVVGGIASMIRNHWDFLRRPNPEVIDRALVLQGRKMRFAQEAQRRLDREKASIRASEAFHAGDFRKAVDLLAPFRDDASLSSASRRLYELALKRR